MDLNSYQTAASTTAIYPGSSNPEPSLIYAGLKLAGEAGEVAEKIGKAVRSGLIPSDDGGIQFGFSGAMQSEAEQFKKDLVKELGDVLWYVSAIATELDEHLSTVAKINLAKLEKRKVTGTLDGSGDDREEAGSVISYG